MRPDIGSTSGHSIARSHSFPVRLISRTAGILSIPAGDGLGSEHGSVRRHAYCCVRVVQSGSFSATAREVGVGQPFVSKQFAQLEAHLGAQLLRRTSRSMTLTEAGQSFYEATVQLR